MLNNQDITSLQMRWRKKSSDHISRVIKCLRDSKPLDSIGQIEIHDSRWDLRGLPFPDIQSHSSVGFVSWQVERISGQTWFKNARLIDIDLSYSDINNSVWENCQFNNVVLNQSNAKRIGVWASSFEDVSFRGANLKDACLGGNIGKKGSRYSNVDFSEADLRQTAHGFEEYIRCSFRLSNLHNVDFDGARFSDVIIEGELDSVLFHKYSRMASKSMFPWDRIDTRYIYNKMHNVDFVRTILKGVDFDGIDLSSCTFPNDNIHLVVNNAHIVFEKLRDYISMQWKGEDQRIALRLIDDLYLSPEKRLVPIQVINKNDLSELISQEFAIRLCDELSRINMDY